MNLIRHLNKSTLNNKLSAKFPDVIFRLSGPHKAHRDNSFYVLGMMLVPFKQRQKKVGTNFMKALIKESEYDIFLTPDDSYQEKGQMSKKDLENWYKKFGFVKKHKDDFRSMNSMCFYKTKEKE